MLNMFPTIFQGSTRGYKLQWDANLVNPINSRNSKKPNEIADIHHSEIRLILMVIIWLMMVYLQTR